jgi:hypothetical protein
LGVIIIIGLIGLFIYFLLRYRRKLKRTESELSRTKADAAAAAASHALEKAYLDSILTAAGKPDTSSGGRIVVADLGSRKSGDWKQFFASKANSARAAVSSLTNSRPGSRRASRVSSRAGPVDDNEVPALPTVSSPNMLWETGSDRSNVGLVSGEKESVMKAIKRKPLPTPPKP